MASLTVSGSVLLITGGRGSQTIESFTTLGELIRYHVTERSSFCNEAFGHPKHLVALKELQNLLHATIVQVENQQAEWDPCDNSSAADPL